MDFIFYFLFYSIYFFFQFGVMATVFAHVDAYANVLPRECYLFMRDLFVRGVSKWYTRAPLADISVSPLNY